MFVILLADLHGGAGGHRVAASIWSSARPAYPNVRPQLQTGARPAGWWGSVASALPGGASAGRHHAVQARQALGWPSSPCVARLTVNGPPGDETRLNHLSRRDRAGVTSRAEPHVGPVPRCQRAFLARPGGCAVLRRTGVFIHLVRWACQAFWPRGSRPPLCVRRWCRFACRFSCHRPDHQNPWLAIDPYRVRSGLCVPGDPGPRALACGRCDRVPATAADLPGGSGWCSISLHGGADTCLKRPMRQASAGGGCKASV